MTSKHTHLCSIDVRVSVIVKLNEASTKDAVEAAKEQAEASVRDGLTRDMRFKRCRIDEIADVVADYEPYCVIDERDDRDK